VTGDGRGLIRVSAAGINGAISAAGRAVASDPPGRSRDSPASSARGENERGDEVMALLPGGGTAVVVVPRVAHSCRCRSRSAGRRRAASGSLADRRK